MVDEQSKKRGQAIERLRERHLWSQRELSRRTGMSPSALPKIEKGEVRIQLNTIGRLAEVFGVPPEVLLYPEENLEAIYGPKGEGVSPQPAVEDEEPDDWPRSVTVTIDYQACIDALDECSFHWERKLAKGW